MTLKAAKIVNFRKHENSRITFEDDVTVIVGENDTGKSTLINAIQIVLRNDKIEVADFLDASVSIEIELELDEKFYTVFADIIDGAVKQTRMILISARDAAEIKRDIDGIEDEKLKDIARLFGLRVASNSRIDSLKTGLMELLNDRDRFVNGKFIIHSDKTPEVKSYFLSGLQFENIDKFVNEAFFKSRQKELWSTPIEGITLADFIQNKLIEYKSQAELSMIESGVNDTLRQFIPNLSSVEINPSFENKDLSVSTTVSIVTSDGERQSVSRFGDGMKRRLTIALLQNKAREEAESALYLLDEPDTHLHVKAQNELLDALDSIAMGGSQIIVTTHSPFIMNSVDTRQVRVFSKKDAVVRIRDNIAFESMRDEEFRRLGIENLHLFFSRKFIIVEGETEEAFIPLVYRKFYNRPISRDFVKIIKRSGISDVPRFAEVMAQCVNPDDIFIIVDNDALPDTQELIDSLKTPNVYKVGRQEFEDAFQAETIFLAWKAYVEAEGGTLGTHWTTEAITDLAFDPGTEKFSKSLREKNAGCKIAMTKPKLGIALANFCEMHVLPEEIQTLIRVMHGEIVETANETENSTYIE